MRRAATCSHPAAVEPAQASVLADQGASIGDTAPNELGYNLEPLVRKQTYVVSFATRERARYGTRLVPPEDAAGCIRFCLQRTARHPWLLAAHQRRSRSLAAATVHIPETTFYELFFLQTASVMGIRFGLSGAQGRACETKALHDIPTGERLLPSNCTRSPQSRNICYHDGS